ncbi:hypothetical protein HYX13_00005 [Candidatus Woesearchaeota archaeon]|nr:hypothetical protein [Candidatus Woesearchaeota archaeon]
MALSEKVKRGMTITFLVLLVIGFVVPGFLNFEDTQLQDIVEPRLCQTDSECYLTCEDTPLIILCSQNLCQQNACKEPRYFAYQEKPLTFSLAVEISGDKINLAKKSNEKDLFVKFNLNNDKTEVFSKTLSLQQILEKARILYQSQGNCVELDGKEYCTDASHQLKLTVNDKDVPSFPESYVPKEGDIVVLKYR